MTAARRLLLAAAPALVAAAAGCAADLGPGGPWIPWQEIEGALRPELEPPPDRPPPPASIRLVTFNVHLGADPEALARAIAACPDTAAADLLLLQEIESHPAEGASRAARLAAALGAGHVYAPARPEGDGSHGLAIVSRLPLERVEVMELPAADLGGRSRRRIALAADVTLAGGPLRVINVHLDTRINIADRILQLRPALLDQPDPVVVAGDMNANPYLWVEGTLPVPPHDATADTDQAPLLDDYLAALGFDTPTASLGPTFHAGPVQVRLDAIYPRGLAPRAAGVDRCVDASDHWPLRVDLAAIQPALDD